LVKRQAPVLYHRGSHPRATPPLQQQPRKRSRPMNKPFLVKIGITALVVVGVIFVVFKMNPFGVRQKIAGV
jgi:hypothetical protein